MTYSADSDCTLCLVRPAQPGDNRCGDCARYDDYWQGLTPEQRREEERMIAAHVSESTRDTPPGGTND